jgi:hypothetical protein
MTHAKPSDKKSVVSNGFRVPTISHGTIHIQDSRMNILTIDDICIAPYFTKDIIFLRVMPEKEQ